MNVLVAMDSFKGSFSSLEAAGLVESGIRKVYPSAVVEKIAVADGGEGTVSAIRESIGGNTVTVRVSGPLGQPVDARYLVLEDSTAVIEMAEAAGLCLVPPERRDPSITTTFGVGQLILDALDKGCRSVVLCLGGSATNDGGAGMAKALGIRFLDRNGKEIGEGGGSLGSLDRIDLSNLDPRIESVPFTVACDVDNPLCGPRGASHVFGAQKGGTAGQLVLLDANLGHLSQKIKDSTGTDVGTVAGGGAAGGLCAGAVAFLDARIKSGVEVVMDAIGIDEKIGQADVVITGEGRIDGQTAGGKTPVGIALRSKKQNKPVFAIAGFIGSGAEQVYAHGIDSVMSAIVSPMGLEEAIRKSAGNIEAASERLFRIIKCFHKE